MTEAENAIFDLELQIRWIRDNEHHQFPGWMNTIMAMEQAVRLIKKLNIIRCKDCINCVKEPNGELYCDILAVGYEPLGSKKVNAGWFCADWVKKNG